MVICPWYSTILILIGSIIRHIFNIVFFISRFVIAINSSLIWPLSSCFHFCNIIVFISLPSSIQFSRSHDFGLISNNVCLIISQAQFAYSKLLIVDFYRGSGSCSVGCAHRMGLDGPKKFFSFFGRLHRYLAIKHTQHQVQHSLHIWRMLVKIHGRFLRGCKASTVSSSILVVNTRSLLDNIACFISLMRLMKTGRNHEGGPFIKRKPELGGHSLNLLTSISRPIRVSYKL